MELTYVTIVVLASMIFVLSGMVGYLYWQQTRMLQHLQSLAMALATHVENQAQLQHQVEPEPEEEEDDDRVSVKEQVEVVEGPPSASPSSEAPTATEAEEDDVDDLKSMSSAKLRELLTKKGIPFGKRDSKTVLLELLNATA
jgi:hypothetical protein